MSTADGDSFVPLKDASIQDITVILNNLGFAALVEPFRLNAMNGKAINRIKDHQRIVDIGKGQINEVIAENFFEDYVVEWKSTGLVPRELLQPMVSFQLPFEILLAYSLRILQVISPSKDNPPSQPHPEQPPLPVKKVSHTPHI